MITRELKLKLTKKQKNMLNDWLHNLTGEYNWGIKQIELNAPGFGNKIKLGKPLFGKKGTFHSKVSGRPFVFEEMKIGIFRLKNYSISEIRSIEEFSKYEIK